MVEETKQEVKPEEQRTTTKSKAEKATTTAVTQVQAEPQHLIYVGPILERGRLRTNQSFVGGYPVYHQDLFDKYNHLKTLFVPPERLSQAQRDIVTPGHPLNAAYKSVSEVK